jgi:hypothetical protein
VRFSGFPPPKKQGWTVGGLDRLRSNPVFNRYLEKKNTSIVGPLGLGWNAGFRAGGVAQIQLRGRVLSTPALEISAKPPVWALARRLCSNKAFEAVL